MTVLMSDRNERTFRDLTRELQAAGRSPKTVSAYHQALLSLTRWLDGAGQDTDLLAVTRADVIGWLTALRQTHAKDSIVSYFTSARRFYSWAAAEQLLGGASPMARLSAPPASGKPVPIPSLEDVRALLEACQGRGLYELRDMAIIRLFCETGSPRLSEVALLPLDRVDLKADFVTVVGKGGKWRGFPLAAVTARALSRYLRARDRHPWADKTDRVFLGTKGPLLPDSVHKIVKRRCAQAGIAPLHPHQLRHFGTHRAKQAGMSAEDIMTLNGWSSTKMLERYARAAAGQRAADASRALSLANQL